MSHRRPLPRKGSEDAPKASYEQTRRGLCWWELGFWQHLPRSRGPPQWPPFCVIAAEWPIILRC